MERGTLEMNIVVVIEKAVSSWKIAGMMERRTDQTMMTEKKYSSANKRKYCYV